MRKTTTKSHKTSRTPLSTKARQKKTRNASIEVSSNTPSRHSSKTAQATFRKHNKSKQDDHSAPHTNALNKVENSHKDLKSKSSAQSLKTLTKRAGEGYVAQQEARALPEAFSTQVQMLSVTADETGMRVDRFMEARFKGLSFSHIQRIVRKGQLRVNSRRVDTKDRLTQGDQVRVPPLYREEEPAKEVDVAKLSKDALFLKSIVLYEDADVMILNKPMGLAVQGGSGTYRHVDGMLSALTDKDGQKPRLVHRLDKDTAGCLVVAKTRFAAMTLAKSFRSRSARKIYWAVIAGVPRVKQGRISTYLAKQEAPDGDSRMRISRHGDDGASHALTYYAVIDTMAQKLAWVSLKPVTGRTHQLRAHAEHMGHPIIGDPKYFHVENWELPGGIQDKLHLLARRIVIPHPRTGKMIDVTAPLPSHMQQTFNLLGFDITHYDPIVEAPEE